MKLNAVVKCVSGITRKHPTEYLTIEDLMELIELETGEISERTQVNKAAVHLINNHLLHREFLGGKVFPGFAHTYGYFKKKADGKREERASRLQSILLPEQMVEPRMLTQDKPDRENAVDVASEDVFIVELPESTRPWVEEQAQANGMTVMELLGAALLEKKERQQSSDVLFEMVRVTSDRLTELTSLVIKINEMIIGMETSVQQLAKAWDVEPTEGVVAPQQ